MIMKKRLKIGLLGAGLPLLKQVSLGPILSYNGGNGTEARAGKTLEKLHLGSTC